MGLEGGEADFTAEQPIAEASPPPGGEVLVIDVAPAEMTHKDVADFRLAIEPGQKFRSLYAIGHAIIQFVADFFRKTRNFSGSGGEHISYLHRLETVGFWPVLVCQGSEWAYGCCLA